MTQVVTPAVARPTRTRTFVLSATLLGILLSVAFFPSFYKTITSYDDEGSLLVSVRQFLQHGSLYVHTHGSYGPFYFSLAGILFKLTGHDPTLFSGRVIVLVFTALSAGIFGAAVWRVTRNLAFSLLCELTTYCVLVRVAGTEPMHPGSMIVLVLSVLAYALAGYSMTQGTAALFSVGLTVGALMMIKVNVGIFAAVAVVVAFVVGNTAFPKLVRILVAAVAAVLPFVLMFQLLYQVATMQYAVIVSFGLLATFASLAVDKISLPRRGLLPAVAGAVAAIVVSCVWPLATGSTPRALFHGVVIQPLAQADHLQVTAKVRFELLAFAITVCVIYALFANRGRDQPVPRDRAWIFDAGLGFAALSVLGLAIFGGFGAWLPAIALLPALAIFANVPSQVRLALRFFVPLAVLQFLHAYPVAGSQVAWARVVVCVPCTIAMAVAVERFSAWQAARPALRALAVGSLGVVLVVVAGFLPLTIWRSYDGRVALGLPGTRLVRVSSREAATLHRLTDLVKQHCDTFYSAPGFDSLYIYTGLPTPTGMLADTPGVLNRSEQREIAGQLAALTAKDKRVCVVRDTKRTGQWLASSYGHGPLGASLARYTRRVGHVDRYTVSISNFTGKA